MMIRVQWAHELDNVIVQLSMGLKGTNASYDLGNRGTLLMPAEQWDLFRRTLERGAVKGVIVVIEEVELPPDKKPKKSPPAPGEPMF